MKKYLFFFTILELGFSQATSFAIYGIGENVQNTHPAGIALGNSSFFSGNSMNILNASPSSLWRSELTRFSISSGINYLTHEDLQNQYQHNLTSFTFLFPVGRERVFGFGLQPVYRTNNLKITAQDFQFIGADESISGQPIALKNNYTIDGGISELFFEYSQYLSTPFSAGIKYSFLFGNQYFNDELNTYDVIIDTTLSELIIGEIIEEDGTLLYLQTENHVMTKINKYRKFTGSSLMLEFRYKKSNEEWILSASTSGRVKVETQNVQITESTTFTNHFENSSSAILSDLGFGYQNKIKDNFGFSLETHKKYPFNIPRNAVLFNISPPEENSIHFGTYYLVQNPKIGFWNYLNLRGGAYLKELNFNGDKFFDYGLTLGLGIEYLGQTQSIDFSLRSGQRESKVFNGEYENYISAHLGIITGERWFMKRRRK